MFAIDRLQKFLNEARLYDGYEAVERHLYKSLVLEMPYIIQALEEERHEGSRESIGVGD